MKETLFICASELEAFKVRHPEYNEYEEVYKYGELVGHFASVVEDDD